MNATVTVPVREGERRWIAVEASMTDYAITFTLE
jgi:hypothetical protein